MPTESVTMTTAAPSAHTRDLAGVAFHAEVDQGAAPTVTTIEAEPGVLLIRVALPADRTGLVALTLDWHTSVGSGIVYWQPDWGNRRHLPAEWASRRSISFLRSAPVGSLIAGTDENVVTWALSETLRRVEMRREGVREENARFRGTATIAVPADGQPYEVTLRIDRRKIPFWSALADVSSWWERPSWPGADQNPAQGRLATYCTWYSMHQNLTAERVKDVSELAREVGFRTVILDDGWQTADSSRGYWYCGEWEAEPAKVGDLAEQVKVARTQGVAYILWLAPSLLGRRSEIWKRFSHRTLGSLSAGDADILDPRYPEVRQYLTDACLRLAKSTGLDGFKLDFLDAWLVADPPPAGPECDVEDVESGAELWLYELCDELVAHRPDFLIEFRQNYTGPRIQHYGNLFRACDCPMDLVENRARTVDLRLLLPGRIVHSDPLLWDVTAPAEIAAEHLLNGLFAVPQVSVELAALSSEQREMLAFWLSYGAEHADTLLSGRIQPTRPDLGYPAVRSRGATETIVAAYGSWPITVGSGDGQRVTVVNATGGSSMVIELERGTTATVRTVLDHCGRPAEGRPDRLTAGLTRLSVPRSGLVELEVTTP